LKSKGVGVFQHLNSIRVHLNVNDLMMVLWGFPFAISFIVGSKQQWASL
jgi:hypothetical protein